LRVIWINSKYFVSANARYYIAFSSFWKYIYFARAYYEPYLLAWNPQNANPRLHSIPSCSDLKHELWVISSSRFFESIRYSGFERTTLKSLFVSSTCLVGHFTKTLLLLFFTVVVNILFYTVQVKRSGFRGSRIFHHACNPLVYVKYAIFHFVCSRMIQLSSMWRMDFELIYFQQWNHNTL
jgi:hypothetical protein